MFVFYFGILADLTPPTAISTYATSSIAGADVWKTQWTAMALALSGFIIPFSFAYDPALLLAQRLGATHRSAHGGRHPRHPHARGRAHRLPSGAHASVGAGGVTGRGACSSSSRECSATSSGTACFVAVWLAQRTSRRRAAPAPELSIRPRRREFDAPGAHGACAVGVQLGWFRRPRRRPVMMSGARLLIPGGIDAALTRGGARHTVRRTTGARRGGERNR